MQRPNMDFMLPVASMKVTLTETYIYYTGLFVIQIVNFVSMVFPTCTLIILVN